MKKDFNVQVGEISLRPRLAGVDEHGGLLH
jgi:hypothetical protein